MTSAKSSYEGARLLNGIHILAVADDKHALGLLKSALQDVGVIVSLASSPESALAVLKQLTPDVLVVDIMMKERTMLIEAVRNLPQPSSGVPAIAITTVLHDEPLEHVLPDGFQAYVRRPNDTKLLREAILNLSGRKRRRHQD